MAMRRRRNETTTSWSMEMQRQCLFWILLVTCLSSNHNNNSLVQAFAFSRIHFTTQQRHQPHDGSLSSSSSSLSAAGPRKKPPRFTQSVHAPSSSQNSPKLDKDRMWNTRKKSIEELEDIMLKRWGTDSSSFTASDQYYDDADDEEDDDEGEEIVGKETSISTSSNEQSVMRARPVLDPWASDLQKQQQQQSAKKMVSPEERALQKVKRNQERLQQQSQRTTTTTTTSSGDYYNDESPTKGSLEFMMRPTPAGGVGRRSVANDDNNNNKDDQDKKAKPTTAEPPVEAGPGFFFRPVAARDNDSPYTASTTHQKDASNSNKNQRETTANEAEKKPTRPKSSAPKALLDEQDGKTPLYLTLEQAERNFRKGLESLPEPDLLEAQNMDLESFENQNLLTSSQSWSDLGITDSILLQNLRDMNCGSPLSVQAKACPSVVQGTKDVVVGTYTGSGKTLAFLVPLAQRLLQQQQQAGDSSPNNNSGGKGSMKVLVVAPGRELASQIVAVAREVLANTGLSVQLAIGGTTFTRNLEQLRKRKPDIVVGTPGRIAELVVGRPGDKTGRLKTSALQALVLDEFDALLEYKPHREPTMAIVENVQRHKQHNNNLQSILCSATASDVLDSPKLQKFLRPDYALAMADDNDIIVTSSTRGKSGSKKSPPPRVSKTVVHGVVHVPHRRLALDTLRRILHTEPFPQQILIFVENSRKVDMIVERLEKVGILAAPLHGGNKSEKMDRAEVNKALREGYVGIVVATELAARGLDAPLLTHVVNLDLPTDASHYAHRAGRCGRGGRPGVVLNLTTDPKERKVPQKFANQLGIDMFTVEVKGGKLGLIDPATLELDP